MNTQINFKNTLVAATVVAVVFLVGILVSNSTADACSFCSRGGGGLNSYISNSIRNNINNSNTSYNNNNNQSDASSNATATGGSSYSRSDNNSLNYISINGGTFLASHTNNNDDLDVECRASDTSIDEGDRVTFTALVDGGNSPFDYDWSGATEGEDRNDDQIRVRYDDEGRYSVRVTVEDDDGNEASDTCPIVDVDRDNSNNNDDLEVTCKVSDTRVDEGDRVTYEADVDGGNSPFEYDWNGDISGDDREERVRFNRDGRYEVSVTVEDDDGNRDTDDCPDVRVDDDGDDDDDDDNDINIFTTTSGAPTGQVAGLSSVFLSQVPRTGVFDTLMNISFTLILLLWSAFVVYLLRRNKKVSTATVRVQEFKDNNKNAKIV